MFSICRGVLNDECFVVLVFCVCVNGYRPVEFTGVSPLRCEMTIQIRLRNISVYVSG